MSGDFGALVERDAGLSQRLAHRGELSLVLPPTPNGSGVGRLPHLHGAGGGDTRIALMKIEAGVFPIEAQSAD